MVAFAEFKSKRVVVTGCSSGIGLATASALVDLGADVIGMSRRAPDVGLAEFHALDLTSVESIESAATSVDGEIDALFNCAGAPPTVPSVELVKVNFLGTRLLTEHLVERMSAGGAIANVSSSVACGWRTRLGQIRDFVETRSFEDGVAWYEENEHAVGHGYPFSKEALNVWTLQQSTTLIARGVRMNSTSPGAVQTPLMEVSEKVFPPELLAATEYPSGRRSGVEEQVQPLLFLNSARASYINGADIAVDGGYWASRSAEGAGSLW
ncbi:coniferyl-alcohol dehydrogenase [Arthrobacter sp. NPDC056691]|uniref:coniferyl-alcohol dehydrogenase n=1 Tax=Arthrobacter sp. NPDC056691 TaxID=3345913 RepID=UPI00366C7A38